MLNLNWVCLLAISNRKVQDAFLPVCLFVLSQIMPRYLQRFGPIAGFRLLGKKVILISCHAKITTWNRNEHFTQINGVPLYPAEAKEGRVHEPCCSLHLFPLYSHEVLIICLIILCVRWYSLLPLFRWQWVLKVCSLPKLGFHAFTLKVSNCRFLDIWWSSWCVPLTNQFGLWTHPWSDLNSFLYSYTDCFSVFCLFVFQRRIQPADQTLWVHCAKSREQC